VMMRERDNWIRYGSFRSSQAPPPPPSPPSTSTTTTGTRIPYVELPWLMRIASERRTVGNTYLNGGGSTTTNNNPLFSTVYNREVVTKRIYAILDKVSSISEDEKDCSVCYGEMTCVNASSIPTCKHVFHTNCINKWCRSNIHHKCPLCRSPINIMHV
jgi:hypothetical protein